MLPLIATRANFLPVPWHTTPDPTDSLRRVLCHGWHCGFRDYPSHQSEELSELVSKYIGGRINSEFRDGIQLLARRGYRPAFSMLGVAGFPRDVASAHANLSEGARHNIWSCLEALSFHPDALDRDTLIEKAANGGGIWSMIRLARRTANVTRSLDLFRRLATALTTTWWKLRPSGNEYAVAVATILSLNDGDRALAWAAIDQMAKRGHLPAALWLAEGLETGEVGRVNRTEAIEILQDLIVTSQWTMEIQPIMDAQNEFDKMEMLRFAHALGNPYARYLLSYPTVFR
jgi:hypothetical protein